MEISHEGQIAQWARVCAAKEVQGFPHPKERIIFGTTIYPFPKNWDEWTQGVAKRIQTRFHIDVKSQGVSGVQNRFGSVFFTQLFFSFFGLQAIPTDSGMGHQEHGWYGMIRMHLVIYRQGLRMVEEFVIVCQLWPLCWSISQACTLWYLDRDRLDRERASKLYHVPWALVIERSWNHSTIVVA